MLSAVWSRRSFLRGIKEELLRRAPFYWSDWRDGLHYKIIASILFMYFSSIGPAITFGAYLSERTDRQIGTVEVLLSTAVTGVCYAVISGQPMVIVGVTGPVSIFLDTIFKITQALNLPFLPFTSWICLWSGLMHLLLASFDACSLVSLVTRFSCEIFGFLIAIIYIIEAILQITKYFNDYTLSAALLSLLLAIGTLAVALILAHVRNTRLFTYRIRSLIADYAMASSVLLFSGLQFLGKLGRVKHLPRLQVPSTFQTTTGRSWLVQFWELPVWAVFGAILPALLLTVLFFFDHNVSSLLSQKKEFKLKKPSAYNWDFFCVGLLLWVCAPLGIPPVNGLIPQAPLHVRSCADIHEEYTGNGHKSEVFDRVRENRVSPLGQATAIGLTLIPALLRLLGKIPQGVLSGIFLYMGFESFVGNQFFDRLVLLVSDPTLRPPFRYLVGFRFRIVVIFTAIQFFCLAVVYGVTRAPFVGMTFPLLILLLIPLRRYVLPRLFAEEHLTELDAEEQAALPPPIEDTTSEHPSAALPSILNSSIQDGDGSK